MNPSTKRILFSTIVIIVLLAACAPAQAPTQDPAQIQSQIAEAVCLRQSQERVDSGTEKTWTRARSRSCLPDWLEVRGSED